MLRAWGIPERILSRAPESPWGFPAELFRNRAEAAVAAEATPSARRALEALPEGGTVLDVGAGAGAASLPLAGRATLLVGVDPSGEMLDSFRDAAERAGVDFRSERGTWPEAAPSVSSADVVVCHHVVYNVPDLPPFVRALGDHAGRRVVVEMTERHPLAWMEDLWERFWDLRRPHGPTADDTLAVLREEGLEAGREDWVAPASGGGFERREDAIGFIRRRLCLPAERDDEVAEALGDRLAPRTGLWSVNPGGGRNVTLWWDRS